MDFTRPKGVFMGPLLIVRFPKSLHLWCQDDLMYLTDVEGVMKEFLGSRMGLMGA